MSLPRPFPVVVPDHVVGHRGSSSLDNGNGPDYPFFSPDLISSGCFDSGPLPVRPTSTPGSTFLRRDRFWCRFLALVLILRRLLIHYTGEVGCNRTVAEGNRFGSLIGLLVHGSLCWTPPGRGSCVPSLSFLLLHPPPHTFPLIVSLNRIRSGSVDFYSREKMFHLWSSIEGF